MTVTQLIARFKSLASYDLDLVGEIRSDLEIVDYLNQAHSELARRTRSFSNKISLTLVANQGIYGLRSGAFGVPLIQVTHVVLDTKPLRQLAMESLDTQFPTWRTDAPGPPEYWTLANGTELIIYPAPLTATSNNFVSGYTLPLAFNVGNPGLEATSPPELHPHIAGLAVALAAEPMATEPQQINRLGSLRANAYQQAETVRAENESAVKGVDWQNRGRIISLQI